jgi:endonuclease YncB( thermonuclease family)
MGEATGEAKSAREAKTVDETSHVRELREVPFPSPKGGGGGAVCRFGLFARNEICRVVKVYDGDSVTLMWKASSADGKWTSADGKWTSADRKWTYANSRLFGIDTPEMRGGTESTREQAARCKAMMSGLILGEILLFSTMGPTGLDKYGRPLVVLKPSAHSSDKVLETLQEFESVNAWAVATLPGCKPYFGGTKS